MGRSTRRGPWLPEEDENLLQLVHCQGPSNWVRISQHMQHRSPKQCRERYHQNLKPSLNHEPISPGEGEVIEQLVQDMGKRWAEIARRLGNRSDNAIKNWWNGSMNRRRRHHGPGGVIARGVGPRPLPMAVSSPPRTVTTLGTRFNFQTEQRPVFGACSNTEHLEYEHDGDFDTGALDRPTPTLLPLPQSSNELHQRNISRQQSYLPRPELPDLPPLFESLSAPTSAQNTPDPFSLRSLHSPMNHQQLRPRPLESRHSYPLLWQPRPHGLGVSASSPTATDCSNLPPATQAPSLISDNQSHCSISPKTISSPRPSLPAPIDTSTSGLWNADQRRNSYTPNSTESKFYRYDEGYVSVLPRSITTEQSSARSRLDPAWKQGPYRRETNSPTESRMQGQAASSPTERDSRMNVSRILG